MKKLLTLVLLAVVVFFYLFEEEKVQQTTPVAKKKLVQKAVAINYEGSMVIKNLDNIDDILSELENKPSAGAGTFDLTTMSTTITTEALKAFSDSTERSLPLLAHWNVGIPEFVEAMDPMYMISRIELGEHVLVSWKLDPYYNDSISSSYYEKSIKKAAELNLPLVFVLPAPESALTKDSYYFALESATNPNVVTSKGDVVEKLSPFGADELWNEVGEQWSSTTLMAQLQEWYPNPPLVLFVSEDEAAKLSWSQLSQESRYTASGDDNFKRTLVGAEWIEKYRQMHDGFKKGFVNTSWKENVKFMTYNKFSENLGESNWLEGATLTNHYMNIWPLTADGATVDFDLSGSKTDNSADAPHVLANNLPFMLNEAKLINPNFAYQLSLDAVSKVSEPAKYRGLTQFALWFLRPSIIRQASQESDREMLAPLFQEVADSVELIHYNEQLATFWREGSLVNSGESNLNQNIPEQYLNDPRWFLLKTDVNPPRPWVDETSISVWAFALVKGEAPNREWLVYAQSPDGDMHDVTVTIPEYKDVLVDSGVNGSFYILSENSTQVKINNNVMPYNWPWRGTSIPADVLVKHPNTITELKNLGANFVRIHIQFNRYMKRNNIEVNQAYSELIQHTKNLLEELKDSNITAELGFEDIPPFHSGCTDKLDPLYWSNQNCISDIYDTVEKISLHFANYGNEIGAYQFISEPVTKLLGISVLPETWNKIQQTIINIIRKNDPNRYIAITPTLWGIPSYFNKIVPYNDPKIIYNAHMFFPHSYTHQGIGDNELNIAYPGKEELQSTLHNLIEFKKEFNVPIQIGSFSVVRWAPNKEKYLQDSLDIFEENQFSWSYWTWNENWTGWNLKYEGNIIDGKPELFENENSLSLQIFRDACNK